MVSIPTVDGAEIQRRLHELGVEAGARHEGEAAASRLAVDGGPGDLADVEPGRLADAAGAGEGGGLGRVADVRAEQVGGSRREDAARDAASLKLIEKRRDRPVSSREHDAVEVPGVRTGLLGPEVCLEDPQDALVPLVQEGALELENGVRAKS